MLFARLAFHALRFCGLPALGLEDGPVGIDWGVLLTKSCRNAAAAMSVKLRIRASS
jgi:hypothetical protein